MSEITVRVKDLASDNDNLRITHVGGQIEVKQNAVRDRRHNCSTWWKASSSMDCALLIAPWL
jgi:hypothetical protein